jgi:hypothetical protein
VNCTLVAAHGGVATPWNSWLFRIVAPCPASPQTHTSPCPTDLFRLNGQLLLSWSALNGFFQGLFGIARIGVISVFLLKNNRVL